MLDNILHWIDNSISPQVHRYRAATQGKLCQYTQLTMEWTCLDHYTTKYANVSTKFKEPLFWHLINSLIINIISLEQNPLVYMEVNVNLPINNKLKRCKGIVQRKHSTHRPNITKMICSIKPSYNKEFKIQYTQNQLSQNNFYCHNNNSLYWKIFGHNVDGLGIQCWC